VDCSSNDYAIGSRWCLLAVADYSAIMIENNQFYYMSQFEIEIKSLLGEDTKATALKEKMQSLDPNFSYLASNKQLNHYFEGGDIHQLYEKTEHLFEGEQHDKFKSVTDRGTKFSVRTRQKDDQVLLVVKASIDEGTSENTVKRIEFEELVNISLDELDSLVLDSGYTYQAKWSRERDEFSYKGANVCLDKNAGYGYLAEFEKIIPNEDDTEKAREELVALMEELEVEELPQDRLARMFDYYNNNWSEYYGTDKTFKVE
jgi:predicted adenylyl cyclase CyaB